MKELKSGYILLSILTMIAFSGTILNAQVHQGAECTACHYSGKQEDSEGCNNCPNIKHVRCDISGFGTVTFPPYVRGEEPYDGVCEVCHTDTAYYKYTGDGATHYDGADCIPCHRHSDPPGDGDMFSPQVIGPQSHNTHFQDNKGPHLSTCTACHHPDHPDDFSLFADGTEEVPVFLETTTVCDGCHSDGGAINGVEDADFGAKANWTDGVYTADGSNLKYREGKDNWNWCLGCHDDDPSTAEINESAFIANVYAPNVMGDNAIYGYNASGHGRESAKLGCDEACHDLTYAHIDGEPRTYDVDDGSTPVIVINEYVDSYRLHATLDVPRQSDEPGQYEMCIQCHTQVFGNESNFRFDKTPIVLLHPEHMSYDFPVWDSNVNGGEIFGIWREDSAMTCPTCHNVHGTQMNLLNDPLPPDPCRVMIRDGKLTEEPGLQLGLYFHWYTEQYGEVGSGQLTPDLPATRSGQMLCRPPFCANQHCHGAYPFYNREPPPVTTTIISESFEGAGYEDWTESVGTNCILEDSSIPGAPPIDFGSQCLKSVSNATGYKARADLVYSSEQANTRTTFYVYVESEDLANGEFKNIAGWLDGSGNSVAVLRLNRGSAGNLKIRLRFYNNGGYGNYDSATISLYTWYKVEFRYDYTQSTWEYKIEEDTRGSGSLTGTHRTGVKQWRLGFWQSSQAQTGVIYLDELTAESFEYL